jgi:hypothetical protein
MLLRRGIGTIRVEKAKEFAATDSRFVQAGNGYVTTREALAEEHELLRATAAGRDHRGVQFQPSQGIRYGRGLLSIERRFAPP